MNPRTPLNPDLLETLSAYLDGKLEGGEKAALEERLRGDPALQGRLEELKLVRDSLRALPPLKPPRALTLTRAQAGYPSQPTLTRAQTEYPSPRRSGFSIGGFALASAITAAAILCFAAGTLSQKLSSGLGAWEGPAPMAAQESAADSAAAYQDKDSGAAMAQPTVAAPPSATAGLNPTAEAPRALGGGNLPSPPAEAATEGEQENLGGRSDASVIPPSPGLGNSAESNAPQTPSTLLKTVAPWMEGILCLAAVGLVVFVVFRRRR
jgi:hypothetical protein